MVRMRSSYNHRTLLRSDVSMVRVGKSYNTELDRLASTYAWAIAAPAEVLCGAIPSAGPLPLIAVGSGGSFTAAEFAVAVHREYTSEFAMAMTPTQAVATPQSLRTAAVLLLSAGGKNPDVLGALPRLVGREPRRLLVLCARTGSPLAKLAADYPFIDFAEFDLPSGKDGFLATNSLLASGVLLLRAYASAYGSRPPLPDTFSTLLGDELGTRAIEELHQRCRTLWERRTLVVLYGPETHAAAVDLESKFTEAALGATQLADYRNFAHGRHHWLAKRGDESGILAMMTDGDREIAEPLLAVIPPGIPVVRLRASGHGAAACLAALAKVFVVVGSAGIARGIDPGNPGVPAFGRKIYHMRAFEPEEALTSTVPAGEAVAIERKSGLTVATLLAQGRLDKWRASYREFVDRLTTAAFRAVVLDYDGTLCDEAHRFEPLSAAVSSQLNRLLDDGAVIGVATGRGKSVKQALRGAIDERLWGQVVVGYYNGGDIGLLTDGARPDGSDTVVGVLSAIANALRNDSQLRELGKLTFRRQQITIEPGPETHGDELWGLLQHRLYSLDVPGVVALRSSHSIDVVAPGTSKRAVVERVRQITGIAVGTPVLCVGDRGRWPGNDFSLLTGPYSLSVDEVSPDPKSCWNLARPGQRGVEVTIGYLKLLVVTTVGLRLKLE